MAKWGLLICVAVLGTVLAAGLNGLPRSITGFEAWTRVAQNLETGGPHAGKNKLVFANAVAARTWKGKVALPVGSIVVKTAGAVSSPDFVAIMEKGRSGWQYREFARGSSGYNLAFQGKLCSDCHAGVKDRDYLFSR